MCVLLIYCAQYEMISSNKLAPIFPNAAINLASKSVHQTLIYIPWRKPPLSWRKTNRHHANCSYCEEHFTLMTSFARSYVQFLGKFFVPHPRSFPEIWRRTGDKRVIFYLNKLLFWGFAFSENLVNALKCEHIIFMEKKITRKFPFYWNLQEVYNWM